MIKIFRNLSNLFTSQSLLACCCTHRNWHIQTVKATRSTICSLTMQIDKFQKSRCAVLKLFFFQNLVVTTNTLLYQIVLAYLFICFVANYVANPAFALENMKNFLSTIIINCKIILNFLTNVEYDRIKCFAITIIL